MTPVSKPEHVCNDGCPKCCPETLAEFNARMKARKEFHALIAANTLAIGGFVAHCIFQWHGKPFVIDPMFVAVIAGAYGASGFIRGKSK